MNPVESLAQQLDKATATLLVSEEGERRFIAESAVAAVALYLLKKYADIYLKSAGFEEMAKRHGEKTRAFLKKLRSGPEASDTAEAQHDLDAALNAIRTQPPSESARVAALDAVVEEYLEAGAVRSQAEREAKKVAAAADQMLGR